MCLYFALGYLFLFTSTLSMALDFLADTLKAIRCVDIFDIHPVTYIRYMPALDYCFDYFLFQPLPSDTDLIYIIPSFWLGQ